MEQFFVFLGFTVVIVLVLFLPALFELKKPKDVGPRKIVGFEHGMLFQAEKELVFSKQPVNGALAALDSLPNLEVNSSIS
jgi:hypothetical protein